MLGRRAKDRGYRVINGQQRLTSGELVLGCYCPLHELWLDEAGAEAVSIFGVMLWTDTGRQQRQSHWTVHLERKQGKNKMNELV